MSSFDLTPLGYLKRTAEGTEVQWECTFEINCARTFVRKIPAIRHAFGHHGIRDIPGYLINSWCRFCRYQGPAEGLKEHYSKRDVHKGPKPDFVECDHCNAAWKRTRTGHIGKCSAPAIGDQPEFSARRWDELLLRYQYNPIEGLDIVFWPEPSREVRQAVKTARRAALQAKLNTFNATEEAQAASDGTIAIYRGNLAKVQRELGHLDNAISFHSLAERRISLTSRQRWIYRDDGSLL
ncbi:hypothetical protein JCM16303_005690 [Sporobolomyces ruberrimus]